MTMITPSYLGETIEYSSLHACRSTLEDPTDMAELKGRKAVERKGQWWNENHEVHSFKVEGPYVHGDQFVVRFMGDVTPKGQKRMHLDEVGLYTVRHGKIVEESFFMGGAA